LVPLAAALPAASAPWAVLFAAALVLSAALSTVLLSDWDEDDAGA
jgi:hypothetical protein